MLENVSLLYVEDNISISEEIVFFLSNKVKKVHVAYNGEEALEMLKKIKPDLIITDIEMPKLNGLDMVKEIKKTDTTTPIIITSAFSETKRLLEAIELGVDSYLIKPISLKTLFKKIEHLTKNILLEKELEKMKALKVIEKDTKYQRLLELSAEISSMAFWEYDIKKDEFTFNDLYYKFLATTAEAENGYVMDSKTYFEKFIPPSSRQIAIDVIAESLTKDSDYLRNFVYQMTRRDGEVLDVSVDCYFTYDSNGNADKAYGTKYNLGKQKKIENELRDAQDMSDKLLKEQNILLSLFDIGESTLLKWKNNLKWDIEYVSKSIETLIPGSLASFKSGDFCLKDYIHKDDLPAVLEEFSMAIKDKKDSFSYQPYRIVTVEKKTKWVIGNSVTKKDLDGNITHLIGYITDITDKKLAEKKIEKYLNLIDENIVISSTNIEGIITDVTTAFCELTGYEKNELIGKTHSILKYEETEEKVYQELWDTVLNDKIYVGEFKNRKKDGSSFWTKIKILPLFNDKGIKTGYISIKQDITDKKIIEELSITDELTKLYNRRYFNEVFAKELSRSKRAKNSLAFVMLDVDSFKLYNDTYGHQDGDKALIEIAKVLKKFTNREGDNSFRLGGEEFGLILLSDSNENIKTHIHKLIQAVEALKIPHKKSAVSKYITISAGVVFNDNTMNVNVDDLYKSADRSLYKAKESGRNKVVFSNE